MSLLFDKQPWMADAACRGTDASLWFPERGEATAEAKAICASCPVREECLDFALKHNEHWGIWGGLASRSRTKERRRRGMAGERPGVRREDVA